MCCTKSWADGLGYVPGFGGEFDFQSTFPSADMVRAQGRDLDHRLVTSRGVSTAIRHTFLAVIFRERRSSALVATDPSPTARASSPRSGVSASYPCPDAGFQAFEGAHHFARWWSRVSMAARFDDGGLCGTSMDWEQVGGGHLLLITLGRTRVDSRGH